jgi:hypothetical protein
MFRIRGVATARSASARTSQPASRVADPHRGAEPECPVGLHANPVQFGEVTDPDQQRRREEPLAEQDRQRGPAADRPGLVAALAQDRRGLGQ